MSVFKQRSNVKLLFELIDKARMENEAVVGNLHCPGPFDFSSNPISDDLTIYKYILNDPTILLLNFQ